MLNDGFRLSDAAHARFCHSLGASSTDAGAIGKPHSIVLGTQPFGTAEVARNEVKSVLHELEIQNGFTRLDSAEHVGTFYECGIKNQAGEYIAVGKLPGISYQQSADMLRITTLSVVINPSSGDVERRNLVPTQPPEPTGRSVIHWGTGSGIQPRSEVESASDEPPPASASSIPTTGIAVYAPLRIKQQTRLGIGLPLVRMPIRLSPGIYLSINNYARFLKHGD